MFLLQGHESSIQALAYSPDGSELASAGDDRTVRLWDMTRMEERATLRGHTASVTCLAYAPQGRWLTTGGDDRGVRLWDGEAGSGIKAMEKPAAITALDLDRNGNWLAVGLDRGQAPSHLHVHPIPAHRPSSDVRQGIRSLRPVWGLAFSPDGEALAMGLATGEVVLWDLRAESATLLGQHSVAIRAVRFSPDGRLLAVMSGREVHLWDLESREVVRGFGEHGHYVWSIAFHPEGGLLATGSWSSAVHLWDIESGAEVARYDWELGRINAVVFSPDGMTAAAAGNSPDFVIWDVDDSW